MTREEALGLIALSVRSHHDPATEGDIGLAPDTVARIIETIPLGRCPRWLVERPKSPGTRTVACTVPEVRELAGLMLGERGRILNESILDYCDSLCQGHPPPLMPATSPPEPRRE